MGVYLPNMEMPTKGYRLILINADGTAQSTDGETTAVPVSPHGRLIDADKQDVQIDALIERHLHGYTKSTWDFVCELRDILKRNSTIIPAEEEQR